MMVAIALGLFLVGGLLTLVQAMSRSNTNQAGLSQLQDNERMAMQLVTDVVSRWGIREPGSRHRGRMVYRRRLSGMRSSRTPGRESSAGRPRATDIRSPRAIRQRWNESPRVDNVINCTGNASANAGKLSETAHRREQLFDLDALGQRRASNLPWRSFQASPT